MENKKSELVLVAVDFLECSDYAVEHAVGIAEKYGFKVNATHVYSKKSKESKEEILAKLDRYKQIYAEKSNVVFETSIFDGNPFSDLGRITADLKANFLVIGTRGKTGVEYIIGNYAEKIIASCNVPVLTVQKRHFDASCYKNIVLPVDQTEETRQKFRWAIEFAKRWDATLHIFAKRCTDEFYVKKVKNSVLQVKSMFDKLNISYTVTQSEDKKTNFTKQIVQFAVDKNADLIIMMADVESMIPSFLTGSFLSSGYDEELINKASQIPTLNINPVDYKVVIGGL